MGQVCNGECNSSKPGPYEVIKEPVNQQVVINDQRVPGTEPVNAENIESDRKLTLEIVGARGLRNGDWWPGYGKSDCYCVVKCEGKAVYTTKVISDCLEPQWRETVEAVEWQEGQNLEFHIFDKDLMTSNSLGKVILESRSFATEGFNKEVQVLEAGKDINAFLHLKIKVPGKDFPAGPETSFEIQVDKGSASTWGLDFDIQDPKILCVSKVKPGPFQLHNQGSPPEKQLMVNDFFKSINGIERAQAMLAEFKAQKQVRAVVVRCMEFTVCLDLTDPSTAVGLKLPAESTGGHVVIFKVLESGAVPEYNRKVPDETLRIREYDRIVAARGVRKGGAHIQDELTRVRGKIQITIMRPAVET